MADVFEEYGKLGQAYESDGWKLLRSKYSRVEVAMLNAASLDRSERAAVLEAEANFRDRGESYSLDEVRAMLREARKNE